MKRHLNAPKSYDPIPVDESIICNGKVIGVMDGNAKQ